jgi:DNA-binding protein Fis
MLARRRTKPADRHDSKPLRMLVVNTSPQLRLAFPEEEGGITVTQKRLAQVPAPEGDGYGLIVAETPADWEHDGGRLRRLIETKSKSYVILAPGPLLQQTAAEIREVGRALRAGSLRRRGADHASPAAKTEDTPDGGFLQGALHRKLLQFVKAYNDSGGRSLYSVVMREFERPLLELALAQTRGNQRRTAELLGMNRNTLRKRMQECRLLPKAPTARRRSR